MTSYDEAIRQALRAHAMGAVEGLDFVGGNFGAQIPGYPNVGNLDFVGAAAAANTAAMQQAMGQAAMAAPQGGIVMPWANRVMIPKAGVYSTEDAARIPRRKIAGFPIVTIPIGGTSVIAQMLPQEAIRPERLVIQDATTGSLVDVVIDDIKVGARSQNVGSGPIPAEVFATTAFDTLIEGNTVNPGISIAISLRLLAPAVVIRNFTMSIQGRSAEA